jgi:hypothetical protein
MVTYTALTKFCCPLSQEIVCLNVFGLENSAIIRQKYCVFTFIPFTKLCYYSSQDTLYLYVFRLENYAIIR